MSYSRLSAALMLLAGCCGTAAAASNDYSDAKTWLCRPGGKGAAAAGKDACEVDLTTTVVSAEGKLTKETWTGAANAPIDCFYVYPTVSTDTTPNSDMNADPAEINVIRQQFARFGSQCRLYAPLYRQITIAGLRVALSGRGGSLDGGQAYDDVLDAWKYYLEHDNQGRGFVLVGHSQGSALLQRLIAQEIDGKPVQQRMVSAIIPGFTLAVPKGQDVGGTFKNIPVCKTAGQLGCVIAYSVFRSNVPPPANTLFGKVTVENMTAVCVNPADLVAGSSLHAYLSSTGQTITSAGGLKPWVNPEVKIETPWVSVPGLITGKCTSNEHATYLEMTLHPDPAGKRVADITGDLMAGPTAIPSWGMHLVDVNLLMGDLVEIVAREAKAYAAKGK